MKTNAVFSQLLPAVLTGTVLAVVCSPSIADEAAKKKPPKVTYADDVAPILRQKCFSCHNPDKKSGDLDLTNYTNLMLGGASGEVVEPGDSSASYLYSLVTHESEPFMPPEQPKLPDEMLETIRKWIDGGVLETKDSTANIKPKKTVSFALQDVPTARPEVPPMPPRLPLEPVIRTSRATAVSAMATSPWSPIAAIAGQEQVLLYNTDSLELVGTLPFPEGVPEVLKFSRNGSLLLAGGGRSGASGKAIVWNIKTGERIFEVGDELDTVLAADISSDQTLIALGGPQRVVRIYSTETGRLLHELRKHTDWIFQIEFSPDSVLLATGDRNGGLYVWEGWTGREYLTLKGHSNAITGISWRADSNVVASGSEDTSIKLWEMNNGGQIKSWAAHGGGVASIEFARDGRILSCGRDKRPKLWDQNGKALVNFEEFGDLALRVTFCDETNRAIAGDWNGAIRVWNAADGKRVGELTPNPPTLNERLAAAQKLVATRTTELKPLAAAYQAAQAKADQLAADLKTAQQKMADSTKQLTTLNTQLTATKQTLTKVTAEHQTATNAVTKLTAGVPVLQELATKSQDAVKRLPGDKEVAELAAKLAAVSKARNEQLAAARKLADEKAQAIETAKAAIAKAEQQIKTQDAVQKQAAADIKRITPLIKPAVDAATAAKQKSDAAAALLAAAQKDVSRWNDEIAFANQIKELAGKREAARQALEEQEVAHAELIDAANQAAAEMNKLQAEIKSAETEVASAQKQVQAAQAKADAARKAVEQATAEKAAAEKTAQDLEQAIPLLTDAVAKATNAAELVGKDKELTAVAAQLKALVEAKQKALAAAKTEVTAKVAAVAAAQKTLVAEQKNVTVSEAALAAAQKQVTELAAAMKPMEAKANEAKEVAEEASKKVEAAQQQLEQIVNQIAQLKGVASA